jgi:hypothetical protein
MYLESTLLPQAANFESQAPSGGYSPRDAVPTFILHGGGFGAPDRMKLGTAMLLFLPFNQFMS